MLITYNIATDLGIIAVGPGVMCGMYQANALLMGFHVFLT